MTTHRSGHGYGPGEEETGKRENLDGFNNERKRRKELRCISVHCV